MNIHNNSGRIVYWDIIKGITILLVILGHTAGIPKQLYAAIFLFVCRCFLSQMLFYQKI